MLNWVSFGDEWIDREFLKIFGGVLENWHCWLDAIAEANRGLKWPIFCNILGILLRARHPRDLGNFEPRLPAKLGHFRRQWIEQDFLKNFGEILGNWHFWQDIIWGASRELKWPIFFFDILRLLLWARSHPQYGQFWAAIICRTGPLVETNELARIFSKMLGNLGKLTSIRALIAN